MQLIGNIIWIILIGWESALVWLVAGLVCCITVIGIPIGLQCFKFAKLSLVPFGQQIVDRGGATSMIANIIWFILCGLWLGLGYLAAGVIFCISIIGIPFGLQCFKLMQLSFIHFGKDVISTN